MGIRIRQKADYFRFKGGKTTLADPLGLISSPDPPPAVDPSRQIAAQAAVDRYNTTGPTGSTTWQQSGKQVVGYDAKGKPIYGTNWSQNTTLSPSEQSQLDTSNQIAETLLKNANGQVEDLSSSPFSYDQDTPEAAKAAYQRQVNLLQPQFDRADTDFGQTLANQGVPLGSDAYKEALAAHEGNQNTALTNAALQSEEEGSQLALSQRQQQYNELASALGGQQVYPTNAFSAGGAGGIDVSGAYNAANQSTLAGYNANQQSQANTASTVGTLGVAAITLF